MCIELYANIMEHTQLHVAIRKLMSLAVMNHLEKSMLTFLDFLRLPNEKAKKKQKKKTTKKTNKKNTKTEHIGLRYTSLWKTEHFLVQVEIWRGFKKDPSAIN